MDQETMNKAIEEVSAKVAEKIEGPLTERIAEKVQASMPTQTVPLKKGEVTEEGKEKVGKFFQALVKGDDSVMKDLSSGVDADGGYLVPNDFYPLLLEKKAQINNISKYVSRYTMKRDKMDVPAEGNAVSLAWKAENAAGTQSDTTFGNITLSVNTLFGFSAMSRELLADSPLSVADIVAKIYAKAFANEEAKQFMTGNGTGKPKGIRTYTISQAVAQAGASLVANDVEKLFFTLPSQYRENAAFVMHNNIIQLINALRSTTGEKLYPELLEKGTLLGKPVIEQNDIPVNLGGGTNESEIFFGDLSYYLVGDREQMAFEMTTVGGSAFTKHQAYIKGYERIDGQLGMTEAFAKMTAVK